MRVVFAVLLACGVAACGADGEPVQPSVNTGVSLNQDGVSVGTNIGLSKGPFNLSLGLGL